MFQDRIQRVHPEITEQGASELRDFLVTAHQRLQSDNQVLSMGLQALNQEVLDEGYDWSELITILVNLVSADMKEDQHERFVAELDRLYASNASLMEVGSVMASDYSSALETLQLLIQEAQKEHETLAGMAGGTSKFTRTWKKNPNRSKMEKGEAIGVDVLEVAAVVGVVGVVGYLGYKGYKYAMTRGGGEEAQVDTAFETYTGDVKAAADKLDYKHMDNKYENFDDLQEYKGDYMNDNLKFDFKAAAKEQSNNIDFIQERTLKKTRAEDLMRNPSTSYEKDLLNKLDIPVGGGSNRSDFEWQRNCERLVKDPEFSDYLDTEKGFKLYNEYKSSGDSLESFAESKNATGHLRKDYVQVESLADNAARDTGPGEIIDPRAQAMRDFKEVGDTMTSMSKGEPVKFGGKASEVTENSIENYATGALSSHMVKHPDHIKRIIDEKLSPSTWEEVSRTDEPRLRKVRLEVTGELKGHYKSQIEDFIRDNPDATEMDLKLDTKALIDPDKPINPDDLDEDNLVSRVMNDDSRLIDTNINFRRARREAMRAVNNNDLRIEPPDHKKGGQNDAGRLDNDGGIDSLLEAPQKIAESIEEGVGGEIEEVVPQVEDKVVGEVAGTVEADIEAAEEAAEGAEQELI